MNSVVANSQSRSAAPKPLDGPVLRLQAKSDRQHSWVVYPQHHSMFDMAVCIRIEFAWWQIFGGPYFKYMESGC